MTSLYNGWTPETIMNAARTRAFQALGRVMDALGAEAYLAWYKKNITSEMCYSEVAFIAEAWLNGDECGHCTDSGCACMPHNNQILC